MLQYEEVYGNSASCTTAIRIHTCVLVSCCLAFSFDQASFELLLDQMSAMANTKWQKSSYLCINIKVTYYFV